MTEDICPIEENNIQSNEANQWDDFYADDEIPPFDHEFKGSYEVDGKKYNVVIQGTFGKQGGKDNFYTVTYTDGSIKKIDWLIDTGWNERGEGQTAHAVEVGRLVEQRFS